MTHLDENAARCDGCGHYLDTDHSGGQHPGHYGWCTPDLRDRAERGEA